MSAAGVLGLWTIVSLITYSYENADLEGPDTYTISYTTSFKHPLLIGSHRHRSVLATPPLAVAAGVQVRLPVPYNTRSCLTLRLHLRVPGFRLSTSTDPAGCSGHRTASFDHFRPVRTSLRAAQD